jgi:hypothetical protein
MPPNASTAYLGGEKAPVADRLRAEEVDCRRRGQDRRAREESGALRTELVTRPSRALCGLSRLCRGRSLAESEVVHAAWDGSGRVVPTVPGETSRARNIDGVIVAGEPKWHRAYMSGIALTCPSRSAIVTSLSAKRRLASLTSVSSARRFRRGASTGSKVPLCCG